MNGIIGMTGVTLETELTRAQRENLMIVSTLANSLLLIIDDILDISKSGLMGRSSDSRIVSTTTTLTTTLCDFNLQSKLDG